MDEPRKPVKGYKGERAIYHEEDQTMSDVRPKVAFITASDLHFSQEAPRARAEKGDEWLKAQWRYMEQLRKLKSKFRCEVVYAGDIFHTWKEPAEIVNLVIQNLPPGYGIPGQHDLPYHRYEDKTKSPYWTLVKAGVIEELPAGQYRTFLTRGGKQVYLYGFPWGSEVTIRPPETFVDKGNLHVAVIHGYVWADEKTSYIGAPNGQHVRSWAKKLHAYNVAVFGDNHKGFVTTLLMGGHHVRCNVLNNGHFIRRTRDDANFGAVGVVYEDGSVERRMLDCSADKWDETELKMPNDEFTPEELEQLMRVLRKSTSAKVDFANLLLRSVNNETIGKLARDIIIKALEDSK